MNITFLIGNGFDLNLGLDTSYNDFLNFYLQEKSGDDEEIRGFKADIRRQHLDSATGLWANAELAFGHYTDDIAELGKKADSFSKRRNDFCRKLAVYLQEQEKRVDVHNHGQAFVDAISEFRSGLTEAQLEQVNKSLDIFEGGFNYNFIIFNYTSIIDTLINAAKQQKIQLGTREYKGTSFNNSFRKSIHVHGTTEVEMIFGVNDTSQIANMTIFEGVSPIYLDSFIKQKYNNNIGSRVDEKAFDIIKKSSFIYVYGMSIGDTDKLWWQRIVDRMKEYPYTHVFIYCYDAPKDRLLKEGRLIYEASVKERFLAFSGNTNPDLRWRIHIIDHNIFSGFSNLVNTQLDNIFGEIKARELPLIS